MTVFKTIQDFIKSLDLETLSPERKHLLAPLQSYVQSKLADERSIQIHFLCTHNSRRSHLAQIWAQVMAVYYGIPNVYCHSAGSEETAVFPMVIDRLQARGFVSVKLSQGTNSVYGLKYSEEAPPIFVFSKDITHPLNPQTSFVAVMTCRDAEQSCPNVPGAEKRISIHYEDPKVYDGTEGMSSRYEERSRQIATEMKYIFSKLK